MRDFKRPFHDVSKKQYKCRNIADCLAPKLKYNLLNKFPTVQECDATADAMKNRCWYPPNSFKF